MLPYSLLINLSILISVCGQQYGVVLTSIPSRFSSVHHSINSWVDQTKPPAHIILAIPANYEQYGDADIDQVKEIMHKHSLHDVVDVILLKKDWGPASKYVGMLTAYVSHSNVDYWIVCDDDVRYSVDTYSRYAVALAKYNMKQLGRSVFTHFAVEPRVHYTAPDKSPQKIAHVQGVDTVLFPRVALAAAEEESTLTIDGLQRLLTFFHTKCPASFFQDDYLISLALHLADITPYTLWNGDKVANHVNGVSTSNEQMHLHPKVMRREEVTKECIEHALRYFHDYVKYGRYKESCDSS